MTDCTDLEPTVGAAEDVGERAYRLMRSGYS